jgi:uncharacterized protein YndB with AHSA1/START domain
MIIHETPHQRSEEPTMAPVSTSTEFTINASPDQVMAALIAVEDLPKWSPSHRNVVVESRDEEGRPKRVAMSVSTLGVNEEQIVDYTWDGDRHVSWTLVEGSQQKSQDGSYTLTSSGSATKVRFDLAIELKIPVPGFIVKRAQKMALDVVSKGLKRFVETRS